MISSQATSYQFATLHFMMEGLSVEQRARVDELAREYQERFFHYGAGEVSAMRSALNHLLQETKGDALK